MVHPNLILPICGCSTPLFGQVIPLWCAPSLWNGLDYSSSQLGCARIATPAEQMLGLIPRPDYTGRLDLLAPAQAKTVILEHGFSVIRLGQDICRYARIGRYMVTRMRQLALPTVGGDVASRTTRRSLNWTR